LLKFIASNFGISLIFAGRGFNEALNGFTDEGWSMIGNDGVDDVTILVNSSPDKLMGLNLSFGNGFPSVSNAVLCAKASMLLQVSMLFRRISE
jgi:homeobox-leucine zipper protein